MLSSHDCELQCDFQVENFKQLKFSLLRRGQISSEQEFSIGQNDSNKRASARNPIQDLRTTRDQRHSRLAAGVQALAIGAL